MLETAKLGLVRSPPAAGKHERENASQDNPEQDREIHGWERAPEATASKVSCLAAKEVIAKASIKGTRSGFAIQIWRHANLPLLQTATAYPVRTLVTIDVEAEHTVNLRRGQRSVARPR
jgi:hypothetical protein